MSRKRAWTAHLTGGVTRTRYASPTVNVHLNADDGGGGRHVILTLSNDAARRLAGQLVDTVDRNETERAEGDDGKAESIRHGGDRRDGERREEWSTGQCDDRFLNAGPAEHVLTVAHVTRPYDPHHPLLSIADQVWPED